VLVDATGSITFAFWPALLGAVLMALVGSLAPRMLSRSSVAISR
jgi:uncharacterized membrane protein YvlD (DUF360 family)